MSKKSGQRPGCEERNEWFQITRGRIPKDNQKSMVAKQSQQDIKKVIRGKLVDARQHVKKAVRG